MKKQYSIVAITFIVLGAGLASCSWTKKQTVNAWIATAPQEAIEERHNS